MAIRDQLKDTLTQLTKQEIIQPVMEPTAWINSMVVVPKKNGSLRICLDPKDLNKAIRRCHYPLPTIEDIATRLHGAKVYTIVDVKNGFWHVALDEQSLLFILRLADIGGTVCHLEYVLLWKFFKEKCTRLLKGCRV